MGRLIDLTGNVYGRLTVVCRDEDNLYSNGRRKVFWRCKCECGNTKRIASDNLKQGYAKSCGCLNLEILKGRADKLRREYPSEWESYRGMKNRVKENPTYANLGMWEEWENFQKFLNDMGPKPNKTYTIDRKDTRLGYYPNNCRWASKSTQAYNGVKPTNNTTGHVGVSPLRGKYQATIGYEGKSIYLGIFDTLDQAVDARELAEKRYYGYSPNH